MRAIVSTGRGISICKEFFVAAGRALRYSPDWKKLKNFKGGLKMDEVLPSGHWASYGFGLSARLRSVRVMRGISQVRLAELAGLSRSLVSNLERNHYNQERTSDPTMSTIYRLAYALRVPPAVLLPAVGEEVGQMCWETLEELVEDQVERLATQVSWPVRPEDTQPFAPA